MKKILLLFSCLLVLLLINPTSAAVIKEKSFKEIGLEEFRIEGAEEKKCWEIVFLREPEEIRRENYNVISLHVEFTPVTVGKASLKAIMQGQTLAEIKPEDLKEGWARIILPLELIGEKNTLQICGQTSQSITSIKILNDSKIGLYRMADFFRQESFTKEVSTALPEVNKPVEITITARNYGSEEANVYINYWKVKMKKVELVGGETEFQGLIPAYDYDLNKPGEKSFTYTIFPEIELQMTLPAATLEYADIFQEKVFLRSSQPIIIVKKPEKRINGLVAVKEALAKAGATMPVKVILKNTSSKPVQNITVYLKATPGLSLSQEKESLGMLSPGETREISLTASAFLPGKYDLGCQITYIDENVVQIPCQEDFLYFEEDRFNLLLFIGAIFAAIVVLIYLFIYYKK